MNPNSLSSSLSTILPNRTLLAALTILACAIQGPVATANEDFKAPQLRNVFSNLEKRRPQVVVVYGTSLTHTAEWPRALGEYFEKHYPGLVTLHNSGSSGKQSNWGVANLQKRVLSKSPDLVFIEFSMNDAATKHGISTKKAIANLDSMVKAVRTENPKAGIVLMTMNTVWNSPAEPKGGGAAAARPALHDYYEGYRRYAHEHCLPLVDHTIAWLDLQRTDEEKYRKWVPDGTHPRHRKRVCR